jgi:hypothetical protein
VGTYSFLTVVLDGEKWCSRQYQLVNIYAVRVGKASKCITNICMDFFAEQSIEHSISEHLAKFKWKIFKDNYNSEYIIN